MAREIRIGQISSVSEDSGMVRVSYPDMDGAVTDELPLLSFNGEYKAPEIGTEVLVVHLSNGAAAGICLGSYWNASNVPPETGEGLYRKDFADAGEAYARYKSEDGFSINAPKIILSALVNAVTKGGITIDESGITINADAITLKAKSISFQTDAGSFDDSGIYNKLNE